MTMQTQGEGPRMPQRFTVRCVGTSPMLQDHVRFKSVPSGVEMSPEEFFEYEISKKPRRERAACKLYYGPNRELGIKTEMLRACLRDAFNGLPESWKDLVPSAKNKFDAAFFLGGDFVPFDPAAFHPDADDPQEPKDSIRDGWRPDVRRGAKGLLCRPYFPQWAFDARVTVRCAFDGRTEELLYELFERAGSFHGLGAYRPPHGRFGCFAAAKITLLTA